MCYGGEGRTSSGWIRTLRRRIGHLLQHTTEVYVPSQHVTGAAGMIPALQAECDALAAAAHARALRMSLPCAEHLVDETLLYIDGALVVDVGLALEEAYRRIVNLQLPAVLCWPGVLEYAEGIVDVVRWAVLLRSATATPDLSPHRAACPLCGFLVPNWGWHVLWECILIGRQRFWVLP